MYESLTTNYYSIFVSEINHHHKNHMINLFRILHILFASMTLALLPVSLILRGRMEKAKGTPGEIVTMGNMLWLGRMMGMIGGLGILIAGAALVSLESYKWFAFSEFPWLAWKQTIFAGILVINFAFMMPLGKKLGGLIGAQMASGNAIATEEMRALGAKIGIFGLLMNLLALTAMALGVSKGIF
jgi:hypothetical protein